jgi:hypothetical protein
MLIYWRTKTYTFISIHGEKIISQTKISFHDKKKAVNKLGIEEKQRI